ncbi:endo-1,4-beta-xylanase 2-like [Gigantopelta aegis]|uniref:endo-1,4-beta-xylanase 2-like n=1 Tax=Gigantopelta aegis TaxID=1735272 RepID=UPI001B88B63B|nr:endo-1,4-beta-xylanase 2-like [Gigantopelta aegis]
MESLSNWDCWGCTCSVTQTRYSGNYAIKTSYRTAAWHGPSQDVTVELDKQYSVSVWVRIVSKERPQNLVVTLRFDFQDGTRTYQHGTSWEKMSAADGWVELKGEFTAPNKPLRQTILFVQGPAPGVDFITDHASLMKITTPNTTPNTTPVPTPVTTPITTPVVPRCEFTELLQNADMESMSGWDCVGCSCFTTNHAHSGTHAIQTASRSARWQGPSQFVTVVLSKQFTFSVWARLVNDLSGQTSQTIKTTVQFKYQDGTNHYHSIASNANVRTGDGWIQLKGEFTVPNEQVESTRVYVEGPAPGVDFITDGASLVETAEDSCVSPNLLKNPDMESLSDWDCPGITCSVTQTRHSGVYAIQTSGRTQKWQGPAQYVDLQPGKLYSASVWIKLVNDLPGQIGQRVWMTSYFKIKNGPGKYKHLAAYGLLRVADGWVKLLGDVQVPNKLSGKVKLYIQGPAPGVDFIVDEASLRLLGEWTNWRQDVDSSINQLRKSSISIQVTTAPNINLNEVEIKVTQTKKAFPFGTAVNLFEYEKGDKRYQDFVNQHFNWAVTEFSLKWGFMQRLQGHIRYERAVRALNKLKRNGIKVRGHNIVWSVERHVPKWVKPLYGNTLKQVVHDRIVDIVSKTKNLVEHWDVNNENLHGFFFQEHVNDIDYDLQLFSTAHSTAPDVKMFLNDFGVVAQGELTQAYLAQALKLKQANVGLYGIGVQCHFSADEMPSPTLIKAHLDTLAQAGLPIWVTELDVGSKNEVDRADFYETALRVLYSHPAVEGILIWGFWNKRHSRKEDAALVSGPEFRLNAAGQRVLDLFENQWMTKETHTLSQSGNQFTVDGFHGDYEVKVIYRGQERVDQKTTFTLGSSPHTVTLSVA